MVDFISISQAVTQQISILLRIPQHSWAELDDTAVLQGAKKDIDFFG